MKEHIPDRLYHNPTLCGGLRRYNDILRTIICRTAQQCKRKSKSPVNRKQYGNIGHVKRCRCKAGGPGDGGRISTICCPVCSSRLRGNPERYGPRCCYPHLRKTNASAS